MNCFLRTEDELVVGQEAVTENCLRHLKALSGEPPASTTAFIPANFGTLPPLSRA
jgi:hypothetical protein